jgi:hypothetical protein
MFLKKETSNFEKIKMKFLVLACLSAIALSNLDEKSVDKVEKVVHLSLGDIP